MIDKKIQISFIVTSINRVYKLNRFFLSLKKNILNLGNKKFQLIFIDQSNNVLFKKSIEMMQSLANLEIEVISSKKISLSKARNLGITYAKGLFVAFPDDDCIYPSNLISDILQESFIYKDIRCFVCPYSHVKKDFYSFKFMSRHEVMFRAISFSFFLRNNLQLFNENLGVGAEFGAGEETEYLLRYLKKNEKSLAVNTKTIFHEDVTGSSISRTISYSKGFGALSYILLSDIDWPIRFHSFKLLFSPWYLFFKAILFFNIRSIIHNLLSGIFRFIGFIYWYLKKLTVFND